MHSQFDDMTSAINEVPKYFDPLSVPLAHAAILRPSLRAIPRPGAPSIFRQLSISTGFLGSVGGVTFPLFECVPGIMLRGSCRNGDLSHITVKALSLTHIIKDNITEMTGKNAFSFWADRL
jgi:hypothetical protein